MDILQDGIEGWVARDKDDKENCTKGQLHFFWEKPERFGMYWGAPNLRRMGLSDSEFPNLKLIKWSNKPKKVRLTIQIEKEQRKY